jgi:uncharacterized membrane protein HdeD (DUF308 family)
MFFWCLHPCFTPHDDALNIVLSMVGVCTLVDVVIMDPIQVDLISRVAISKGVVMIVTQVQDKLYIDQHPWHMFLPFVAKVFGCLVTKYSNSNTFVVGVFGCK